MKKKETILQKYFKYEKWQLYPSYIEQAFKGDRCMDRLIKKYPVIEMLMRTDATICDEQLRYRWKKYK